MDSVLDRPMFRRGQQAAPPEFLNSPSMQALASQFGVTPDQFWAQLPPTQRQELLGRVHQEVMQRDLAPAPAVSPFERLMPDMAGLTAPDMAALTAPDMAGLTAPGQGPAVDFPTGRPAPREGSRPTPSPPRAAPRGPTAGERLGELMFSDRGADPGVQMTPPFEPRSFLDLLPSVGGPTAPGPTPSPDIPGGGFLDFFRRGAELGGEAASRAPMSPDGMLGAVDLEPPRAREGTSPFDVLTEDLALWNPFSGRSRSEEPSEAGPPPAAAPDPAPMVSPDTTEDPEPELTPESIGEAISAASGQGPQAALDAGISALGGTPEGSLRDRVNTMRELMDDVLGGEDSDQRDAMWMALAMAGFAMAAGESPNALTNIANGMRQGLEFYLEGQQRQADRRDRIEGAALDLALEDERADRDFQRSLLEQDRRFAHDREIQTMRQQGADREEATRNEAAFNQAVSAGMSQIARAWNDDNFGEPMPPGMVARERESLMRELAPLYPNSPSARRFIDGSETTAQPQSPHGMHNGRPIIRTAEDLRLFPAGTPVAQEVSPGVFVEGTVP